jgi:hypothetical protein
MKICGWDGAKYHKICTYRVARTACGQYLKEIAKKHEEYFEHEIPDDMAPAENRCDVCFKPRIFTHDNG